MTLVRATPVHGGGGACGPHMALCMALGHAFHAAVAMQLWRSTLAPQLHVTTKAAHSWFSSPHITQTHASTPSMCARAFRHVDRPR